MKQTKKYKIKNISKNLSLIGLSPNEEKITFNITPELYKLSENNLIYIQEITEKIITTKQRTTKSDKTEKDVLEK